MNNQEMDSHRQKRQENLKMESNGVINDQNHRFNVGFGFKSEMKVSIKQIYDDMQKLRQDAISKIDTSLEDMIAKMIDGIKDFENSKESEKQETKYYTDKEKFIGRDDVLPEKNFQTRNSMLTDLCNEINHLQTVYNISVTVLIILIMNIAVHNYFESGTLQLGFSTMKLGFGNILYVATIWIQMMTFTISVYVVYTVWAYKHMTLPPKSYKIHIWDYIWLGIFIIYQIAFLIVPPKIIMKVNLPPPCVCIIVFEQLRMVMKIHAFVRSTVPSIISYKPHTEQNQSPLPGFSNFIYFLFAPTIVYCNNYPRTKTIKWRLVAWYFFEFFMTLWCVTFMFERYIIPIYKDYGLEPFDLQKFILRYFNTILPSTVIFLCGFYCLLHTWMNAFAEMLRFGDRLFYKDWWNSMSYDVYYRTWNVVVHDWLYVYIYKDIYEIVAPRNKFLAKFSVFFLSAIFHEYIITFSLNLFCPIMLLVFGGLGFVLIFINRKNNSAFGNIFLWFSLSCGAGFLIYIYAMEYFAKINCPRVHDEFYNLLMPRFLLCYREINQEPLKQIPE